MQYISYRLILDNHKKEEKTKKKNKEENSYDMVIMRIMMVGKKRARPVQVSMITPTKAESKIYY